MGAHSGATVTHPKVAGLVCITAFAPDKGESVGKLIANPPPGAPVRPILPPHGGFLMLDRAKFAASFAADVELGLAEFMGNSRRSERGSHQSGMEGQAELVSGCHRRQDDPSARSAHDGEPGRCQDGGSGGQPRGLRLPAKGRCRHYRRCRPQGRWLNIVSSRKALPSGRTHRSEGLTLPEMVGAACRTSHSAISAL